jgi:hypothetical protein
MNKNHNWYGKQHTKNTKQKMRLSALKKWENKKLPNKYCKICGKQIYKYSTSYLCGSHGRKEFLAKNPNFNRGKTNGWYGKGFLRLGKNNPNFKDGRSIIKYEISHLKEYHLWRDNIYKRDKYRCQECFIEGNGKNLEAHHIKKFETLLDNFIKKYNQFSPIEDRETFVRLAITYEPFWDITNGITLCDACHTHTKNFQHLTKE